MSAACVARDVPRRGGHGGDLGPTPGHPPPDDAAAEAAALVDALRAHDALTTATAAVLGAAGAHAHTAETAVRALLDVVARSEGLVATMARVAQHTGRVALNASIEAARLGDAGREFAVVAEAIRRLAQEGTAAAHGASVAAADARVEVERALTAARTAASEAAAARTELRALAATVPALAVQAAHVAAHLAGSGGPAAGGGT